MSPIPGRDLLPRANNPNKKFTAILVAVACIFVLACLLWGLVLPSWRKKHWTRPSSTRFNGIGGAARYNKNTLARLEEQQQHQNFPSHPAVLHDLPRQSSREVRIYNPRTETPFPSSPANGDTVSLSSITPRRSVSTSRVQQQELSGSVFSPKRAADTYGTAKAPRTLTESASGSNSVCLGDAKDYILAVPAPLALKAKPAGRAPPLTRQLEKFPKPGTTPVKKSDKLPHPNKLFAEIERAPAKKHTSWLDLDSDNGGVGETSRRTSVVPSISPQHGYVAGEKDLQVVKLESTLALQADGGSYRSSITRSGTVTRPKTPVAEIRQKYDRGGPRSSFIRWPSMKKSQTPSTEPLTRRTTHHSSTPPTSVRAPIGHLDLLPTPLRILKTASPTPAATPTPTPIRDKTYTPSSATRPETEAPDTIVPLQKSLTSKRFARNSIGFYHRNGPHRRPARLNLQESFHVQSPSRRVNRHSFSSLGSMVTPPAFPRYQHVSSVYSRDTMGVLRSPSSPTFSTPGVLMTDMTASLPKRAASIDLVRSKIDDWNLHTGHLGLQLDLSSHNPRERVPHSNTQSEMSSKLGIGTAPGGADWV